MLNMPRYFLPLVALSMLAGCSATVTRPGTSESKISAPAIQKLLVVLTGSQEIKADANWEAFREEWQTSFGEAATQQNLTITLPQTEEISSAESAILVRIRVNDFRYVSQAKRYGLGIMTGNAYMDLDVDFVELPSWKSLGSRKYTTSSSAWAGVFSAMTPKQVQAVATEIVSEVSAR